jgi:hypothetical protein
MNSDRTSMGRALGGYELLRKYSTPNQMEQEVLEDRNCDGRMVWIKIGEY